MEYNWTVNYIVIIVMDINVLKIIIKICLFLYQLLGF